MLAFLSLQHTSHDSGSHDCRVTSEHLALAKDSAAAQIFSPVGRHDNGDVICLTLRPVNHPHPFSAVRVAVCHFATGHSADTDRQCPQNLGNIPSMPTHGASGRPQPWLLTSPQQG